jgi:hypothetical protein
MVNLLLFFYEFGKRGYRIKVLLDFFRGARKRDVKVVFHRKSELKRIDGIESEAVAEERCFRFDVVSGHVFELERFDNEFLNLLMQLFHFLILVVG